MDNSKKISEKYREYYVKAINKKRDKLDLTDDEITDRINKMGNGKIGKTTVFEARKEMKGSWNTLDKVAKAFGFPDLIDCLLFGESLIEKNNKRTTNPLDHFEDKKRATEYCEMLKDIEELDKTGKEFFAVGIVLESMINRVRGTPPLKISSKEKVTKREKRAVG